MDTFETKLNSAFEVKFGLKTYLEANGKTLNFTPILTIAIPDEAKSHLSEEQASALFEIPIEIAFI
jgi:hypothetical protein